MRNLKRNGTNELMYKTETDPQTSRINLWLLGERMEGGTVREFGIDMYSLLYLKWITYKDILYNTCNSSLCYVAAWMGMDASICMVNPLTAVESLYYG